MTGNEFHVTYGLSDDDGNDPFVEVLINRTA